MIKILITGGAGNVGGALARKMVQNPAYFVVIVDDLSTGDKAKLPSADYSNWTFVYCDVNNHQDLSEIMIANNFDYVFHYAAVVGVQRTLENPIKVLGDIDGIKNVLSLAKNTSVKRIFYSSSSEVYGEPVELPQHEETTPLNSRVPYAVVKNVGEAFFRSYKKSYDLNFTIFRFFNTYGPNQSVDFVVARFLEKALKNQDIGIYGNGLQTRTFCYVNDNVDTCIAILERDLEMNDVINIGGEVVVTILELAELIIEETNSSSKIIYLEPLEEGDMTRRQPDNSKMRKILDRPLLTIREGVKMMITDPVFLKNIGL
ncbi:NAD-dependent epimerase/dehydratase family protein [Flavobacteriales bacterium]|nr:NAD-dependent epimerase/dehydratase family protein [Flavobacteriales bacterium]